MKLAEALMLRGDLQSKLSELNLRLGNNAVVQEGEQPAEDPRELMQQADEIFAQLEQLIAKINLTNARLTADGKTMTELLAARECLKKQVSMGRDFLNNASSTGHRARGSEIKVISTVPVAELQKQIDARAMQLRKLEVRIQELNWISDLIEA